MTFTKKSEQIKRVVGKGSSQIRIFKDDTVRFKYLFNQADEGDGGMEVSMFCEVGEPFKAAFNDIVKEFNIVFGAQRHLSSAPWLVDTIASIEPWQPGLVVLSA
jgi:hypothetical protein